MSGIVCNFCAICVDADCKFEHSISIKDRRVVKKLYDGLVHPNKVEPNPEKRRANCKFGQICWTEKCGFRHRLAFSDRMKLVDGFNDAKLASARSEKVVSAPKACCFVIDARNSFAGLEIEDLEESVVVADSWADSCDDVMTFDDFPSLASLRV